MPRSWPKTLDDLPILIQRLSSEKGLLYRRTVSQPMRWLFLVIVLLVMALPTVADEVLLVKTRNDYNERDDRLYLELDNQGTPIELVHRVYDIVMGVYHLDDLTAGVALREYRGKAVLTLKISNFDSSVGAEASLTYLKSIVPSARYGVMKFDLRRHRSKWRLFLVGGDRPIKLLFFRTKFSSILGVQQPTGIEQIRLVREGALEP